MIRCLRTTLFTMIAAALAVPAAQSQQDFVWGVMPSDSFRVTYETERSVSAIINGTSSPEVSVVDRIETFWVVRNPKAIGRIEMEVRITRATRTTGDGNVRELTSLTGLTMFPVVTQAGSVETVVGKESALEIDSAELGSDVALAQVWTAVGAQAWLEQPFLAVVPEDLNDEASWQRIVPIPHGMSGQLRCLLSASIEHSAENSEESGNPDDLPAETPDEGDQEPGPPAANAKVDSIRFDGTLKFVRAAIRRDDPAGEQRLRDVTLPFRLKEITESAVEGHATSEAGTHRLQRQELNLTLTGVAGMASGLEESDVLFRMKLTQKCALSGFRRTRISPSLRFPPPPIANSPDANP